MVFKKGLIAAIFLFATLAFGASAQVTDYNLLAPIPELVRPGTTNTTDINRFIPAAVRLTIGIAGVLAVIFIIIGGIQYMSTDAWGSKNDAKSTIQNAFFGLFLAIGAYVILNTINPNLVRFSLELEQVPQGGGVDLGTDRPEIDSESPSLVGCNNCARFPTTAAGTALISYNPAPNGCRAYEGSDSVCVVNRELGDKLLELAIRLEQESNIIEGRQMTYRVTESYPPLRDDYTETCRQRFQSDSGHCVYAVVSNPRTNPINAVWVEYFIRMGLDSGLRIVYEVRDPDRLEELIDDDERLEGGKVVLRPTAPIERFSIYNR